MPWSHSSSVCVALARFASRASTAWLLATSIFLWKSASMPSQRSWALASACAFRSSASSIRILVSSFCLLNNAAVSFCCSLDLNSLMFTLRIKASRRSSIHFASASSLRLKTSLTFLSVGEASSLRTAGLRPWHGIFCNSMAATLGSSTGLGCGSGLSIAAISAACAAKITRNLRVKTGTETLLSFSWRVGVKNSISSSTLSSANSSASAFFSVALLPPPGAPASASRAGLSKKKRGSFLNMSNSVSSRLSKSRVRRGEAPRSVWSFATLPPRPTSPRAWSSASPVAAEGPRPSRSRCSRNLRSFACWCSNVLRRRISKMMPTIFARNFRLLCPASLSLVSQEAFRWRFALALKAVSRAFATRASRKARRETFSGDSDRKFGAPAPAPVGLPP
mmetsp:Transcript_10702/g.28449  ORF Transcript_10702/g.28449 Transcript_10702/m.28449 type:complete len:393 (+) Transcript_10702:436-1614(+)